MTKRKRPRQWPPKGSYPHPAGGYIVPGPVKPGQRIRVWSHLREEPDTEAIAKAVIKLAGHLRERDKKEPS